MPATEPLVLLLHPLPFDGRMWRAVQEDLIWPSVSPDLYGLGPTLVAWASQIVTQIGDRPLVIVGNSVGGSCAIEVSKLVPEQVRALVLLGTKAGVRHDPAARDETLRTVLDEGTERAWHRYWRQLLGPKASPGVVEEATKLALSMTPEQVAVGVRAFHDRQDNDAYLRRWPGMVVLADGAYDMAPQRSERLAGELPQGSFEMFDGVGHYSPLEAPREVANLINQVAKVTRIP